MNKRWCTIWLFLACNLSVWAQTFVKKRYYDEEKTHLKEIITFFKSDSSLHGSYQSLYQNGSLAISGFYTNGKSDSLWVYYFENGHISSKGHFRNGQQVKKWDYYFENGNIKASGIFDNNSKHGYWTYHFENGQEKSAGMFFRDEKEGIWNYFYEDGSLKAQAFFNSGIGVYKEFYPNGKLKTEGKNEHELSEGPWTYYYESGEKEAHGHFKTGLRDGKWLYYYKNGQISAAGSFVNGEKYGVWRYYFQDGTLSSEGEMNSNQRDGFWKLYYQSGEIKGEGQYDQGSGEFIEYYASGKQKSRGMMKEGKKEGKWLYFNEEGLEDGIAYFENGLGKYEGFYPDGQTKMTGNIDGGRRVGQWTLYKLDGTVAGIYKPVYEDEKPIFRTSEDLISNDDKKKSDKPEYKYKRKKLRYFDPHINEYTGYIVATNPAWLVANSIPLSAEYYIQERLGHEALFTLYRDPFFTYNTDKINSLRSTGVELTLRQKFYHQDTEMGMFYFGHQLSVGYRRHEADIIDSLTQNAQGFQTKIKATETRMSYGIFIGDRWVQRTGDSGLTIDFNIGFAVANRSFNRNFDDIPAFNQIFNKLNQRKFYLPIIFTLNIGYMGPKRRTTSF